MFREMLRSLQGIFRSSASPLVAAVALAACGTNSNPGFDTAAGVAGPEEGGIAASDSYDAAYAPQPAIVDGASAPADIAIPDGALPDVPMVYQAWDGDLTAAPGGCKPGHYTGTFSGSYSSFLTYVGVPIPVAGDVSLDLDQSNNGEFYTISNGFVSGTADLLFPYWCDIIGTLNCKTKQIENGALRNCVYCVGAADVDSGTCIGIEGHFNGPLTADYDSSIHAFVNGTWAGSEQTDADAPPDAGGGCKVGPVEYGGCGDWSAQLGP